MHVWKRSNLNKIKTQYVKTLKLTDCQETWPGRSSLKGPYKPYLTVASELSVAKGLLLRGSQLVIPPNLRKDILNKIHTGHQGITKCQRRAAQSVWWPGIIKDLKKLVSQCPICCRQKLQHSEPLLTSPLPNHPWQKVATDLFEWNNSNYILVVDYYSRYIEVAKLSSTTSTEVFKHLKSFFAWLGLPQLVISDNGPQYTVAVKLLKHLQNNTTLPMLPAVLYTLKQTELLKELYICK